MRPGTNEQSEMGLETRFVWTFAPIRLRTLSRRPRLTGG